jgi:hypothetical protein
LFGHDLAEKGKTDGPDGVVDCPPDQADSQDVFQQIARVNRQGCKTISQADKRQGD